MSQIKNILSIESLSSLISGNILAIHIPNYLDNKICDHICSRILNNKTDQWLQHYAMAKEIDLKRIGMSLFETERKTDMLDRYFNEAQTTETILDEICAPFDNPIKTVMSEIDDLWPNGNKIQTYKGTPFNFGLCRVLDADQEFSPHQDFLIRDVDWEEVVKDYINQLAFNLYLRPSDSGGELEIWDYSPQHDELDKYANGTYDFYQRSLLPKSSTIIKPEKGDLVLFRSTCVHAVFAGKGKRISFSNFIAYYGQNNSLRYWI